MGSELLREFGAGIRDWKGVRRIWREVLRQTSREILGEKLREVLQDRVQMKRSGEWRVG